MALAPALPLAGTCVVAAPPAGAAPRLLRLRPARAYCLVAARAPPRPVSVRCAPKTGNFAGAPGPGDVDGPAVDALRRAAVDAFRPLMDNFGHICSLKSVVDTNDYNIGMPFGLVMASLGCYQLFKMDPWTFLDVALGYAFYKLSVLSAEVHMRGFANDFITKIKVAIIAIILIKDIPKSPDSLVWVLTRIHVFHLYLTTFYFAMRGRKQDARYVLSKILEALQTKEGMRELVQILFEPDK